MKRDEILGIQAQLLGGIQLLQRALDSDRDRTTPLENAETPSFGSTPPFSLPMPYTPQCCPDSRVSNTDLDAEGALTDGVVECWTGYG